MAAVQLFISCVSNEFGAYRDGLRRDLDRYNLSAKIQEDFTAGGVPTLDKLDAYIRHCEAVIHLAGDMIGAMAKEQSVRLIAEQYPDMSSRLPCLAKALSGEEALSYTQWEAYLAIYHGKALFIAAPVEEAPRDARHQIDPAQQALQQRHIERLRELERYIEIRFASLEGLLLDLYRSSLYEILQAAGRKAGLHNLPYISLGDLFKGRQDFLKNLHSSLHQANGATASSITAGKMLYGLGGIGKTRLAVEYAWRYKALYNAVFYVFADSPQALQSNLAALANRAVLNLPEQTLTEEEARLKAVCNWLAVNPGWLLILDNVDTEDAAREVEKLLPQLEGGHVLITSRISRWSRQVDCLELDVLEEDDAMSFLLERTKERRRVADGDEAVAREIVADLGRLALALEQAGAYIAQRRCTLAGYVEEWKANQKKILEWYSEREMQYPKSVAVTWLTSFDQLSAPAARLMNRLAFFSPEPVPESLLDVRIPEDESGDDYWAALAELERYSLVTRNAGAPEFTMHRLVQEVAREVMDEKADVGALNEALVWMNAGFTGDPMDVRDWPVLEPLTSHSLSIVSSCPISSQEDKLSILLNNTSLLLYQQGKFSQAEPLMCRALAIDTTNFGELHPKVAERLNNLAQLFSDTGRIAEAEPLLRRALAIDEKNFGEYHPRIAGHLNNLAHLLLETNRLVEAEMLTHRQFNILIKFRQDTGYEHPHFTTSVNNYTTLLTKMGKTEVEAAAIIQSLLDNIQ